MPKPSKGKAPSTDETQQSLPQDDTPPPAEEQAPPPPAEEQAPPPQPAAQPQLGQDADERMISRQQRQIAAIQTQSEIHGVAKYIMTAILMNPRVENFCFGDPLRGGKCGDQESVGAFLAHNCLRMAKDYTDAASKIHGEAIAAAKADA